MPTIKRTDEFSSWLGDLRDIRARAKVLARIDRLSLGNPGDVAPVGDGISEMRIHYGSGYRVYYVQRGEEIVVLLCGGDKSSQVSDIRAAKKLANELEEMAKAKPFDAAEYLDSPEMIAAYINEALESEDASAIAVAIGTVARARGMSAVAEEAGLSRENLYRALGGEAKPEFATVIKVLHALGIDLVAQPQGSKAA